MTFCIIRRASWLLTRRQGHTTPLTTSLQSVCLSGSPVLSLIDFGQCMSFLPQVPYALKEKKWSCAHFFWADGSSRIRFDAAGVRPGLPRRSDRHFLCVCLALEARPASGKRVGSKPRPLGPAQEFTEPLAIGTRGESSIRESVCTKQSRKKPWGSFCF